VPGPRRTPRGARHPLRRRDRPRHDATSSVLHFVPPGITSRSGPRPSTRSPSSSGQHLKGRGRGRRPRGANVRQRDPQRGRAGRPRRHGRLRPAAGTDGDAYLFGALPEAIATRARAERHRRQDARAIGRATFEQLASRAETLAAADRAAEEARAVRLRVERWFGESNFHHAEFADLRRLVQLKEKQGVTVSLVLPTLDEEETIGPIVRRAIAS
jgi:hypothetical protein